MPRTGPAWAQSSVSNQISRPSALDQTDVEDALYAAAERNGLVADDGQRQVWATIRSGLSAACSADAW
jgi:hypothetical protein